MAYDTTLLSDVVDGAIAFCIEKTTLHSREEIEAERADANCGICEYLRYGVAKGVAELMGSLDGTIQAIYVFDPDSAAGMGNHTAHRPRLSPGISMLVWVRHKTAALASLVASMKQAADEEFWRFPCPEANALCNTLDVIIVDDGEVQERRGYGAVVSSIFMAPTRIWHRDQERLA